MREEPRAPSSSRGPDFQSHRSLSRKDARTKFIGHLQKLRYFKTRIVAHSCQDVGMAFPLQESPGQVQRENQGRRPSTQSDTHRGTAEANAHTSCSTNREHLLFVALNLKASEKLNRAKNILPTLPGKVGLSAGRDLSAQTPAHPTGRIAGYLTCNTPAGPFLLNDVIQGYLIFVNQFTKKRTPSGPCRSRPMPRVLRGYREPTPWPEMWPQWAEGIAANDSGSRKASPWTLILRAA